MTPTASAPHAPSAHAPSAHLLPASVEELGLARAVLDRRAGTVAPADALAHVLTAARARLGGLLQLLGQDAGPTP